MNKLIILVLVLLLFSIGSSYSKFSNVYYLIKTNEKTDLFLNKEEYNKANIKDIILFLKNSPTTTVQKPIIDPPSGIYYKSIQVSMNAGQNKIYYTTDGSRPNIKSNVYKEPFFVNENVTIKAVAYDKYFHRSKVSYANYIINDVEKQKTNETTKTSTILKTTETTISIIEKTTTRVTEKTTTTIQETTRLITSTKIMQPTTTIISLQERNILPNPSFENDPYNDYFVYPPSSANYYWDDISQDGNKSLKIISNYSGLTRWLSKTDKIYANSQRLYKATVWMKTENVVDRAVLAINFWDNSLNHLGTKESNNLKGTNDWTKLEVYYTSPENTKYVRIEFRLYGHGTIWIDNAGLYIIESSDAESKINTTTTKTATTTTSQTTATSTTKTTTQTTTKTATTTTSQTTATSTTQTIPSSTGRNIIVSTTGSSSGDGSINRPYDLDTVIGYDRKNNRRVPSPLKPGDIVYLRGGVYGTGGNVGFVYKFYVTGSENNYITFRSYPGETAIINGGIELWGADLKTGWIILRDLEITNTNTVRWTDCPGSNNYECYARMSGISVYASHVKIINNYIHDTANGIYTAETSSDLEIYGNIVQNDGWVAPDRAHGHGIYVQNTDQTSKIVKANIVLPGIEDTGMHLFGNSAQARNVIFENNIHFTKRWLMVSDAYEINDVIMRNNYLWNSYIKISHSSTTVPGFTIENNYIAGSGSSQPEQMFIWNPDLGSFVIKNNVLCFDSNRLLIYDSYGYKADSKHIFDYNEICGTYTVSYKGSSISFSSWKSQTGFNINQPSTNPRLSNKIFVVKNQYEDKKIYVAVYNWENKDSISIDLSSYGFKIGDKYTIKNAMNYKGDPAITGTYNGGSVNIDMKKGWTLAYPIGWNEITKYKEMAYRPENPYPLFGIFVISS